MAGENRPHPESVHPYPLSFFVFFVSFVSFVISVVKSTPPVPAEQQEIAGRCGMDETLSLGQEGLLT